MHKQAWSGHLLMWTVPDQCALPCLLIKPHFQLLPWATNPILHASVGMANLHAEQLTWKPLIMGPGLSLENVHEDNSFLLLSLSIVKWKWLLRVLQPFTAKLN